MASPIIIEWLVRGIPDVQRASRTVQDTVLATERNTTRAAQREAAQRDRILKQEARDKIRTWQKVDNDVKRIGEKAAREAQRSAEAGVKAADRAAQEKVRIVEREEARKLAIRERSATAAGRLAAKQAADEARQRTQQAQQEIQIRRRFASTIGGGAVAGVRRVAGVASYLGNTVAQLGGGLSLADAVNERSSLERQAALLSNNAYLPGKNQRVSTAQILAKAKASSVTTGTDANELLEGLNAFTAKTGNYAAGEANLDFFGKAAKATGTSVKDVMRTAGTLQVQDKNLTPDQLRKMTLSTIMQARQGSVEFEDMARAGGKITRTASSYEGDQGENQRKLLGLSQIGMKTAGNDVAEAATNMANLASDATNHHDKIRKVLGHDFVNGRGQIKGGPGEFMAEIMEKVGGDPIKLHEMGFGQRSQKMFQAMAGTFNEASDAAGGGKKGMAAGKAAVLKEINDVTSSKYDDKDLENDFANVMKTSAEQFEQAVRSFKTELGEKLLPEFKALIPILQQLIPPARQVLDGFIELAHWAESNPFSGLAAAISLAIAGEVGKAAIAQTIQRLIAGSGAGGAPAGGGSGALGALGAAAAAGAATAAVYKPGVDSVLSGQVGGQRRAGELTAMLKHGSAKDKADAAAEFRRAEKSGSYASAAVDASQLVWGGLNSLTGGKNFAADNLKKGQQAREISGNEELKALVAALDRNTAATQASTGAGDSSNPNSGTRNAPLTARGGASQ